MSFLKEHFNSSPAGNLDPRLTQYQENVKLRMEGVLGKILDVQIVKGGLVHHVYRVRGEKMIGIAKVRGKSFSALPDISIDPNNIKYEHRALLLLSDLAPQIFPKVLDYSEISHYILMSDVMPSGNNLEDELVNEGVDVQFIRSLGKTVAMVHQKLRNHQEKWRDEGDEETFKQEVFYRFGYHHNPVLDNVIAELYTLPKQLVLADLSPKNIGRGYNNIPTICDLDAFCRGNLEYALSFLPGHLLLHSLTDANSAHQLITNLLKGYKEVLRTVEFDGPFFKKLTLGAILYRLRNNVIPYNLPLPEDIKNEKAEITINLLKLENPSWETMVNTLTSA